MEAFAASQKLERGQEVVFTVRPEKLQITKKTEMAPGALSGIILEAIYIGTDTRYLIKLESGRTLVVRAQNCSGAELGNFNKGDSILVRWASKEAHILAE